MFNLRPVSSSLWAAAATFAFCGLDPKGALADAGELYPDAFPQGEFVDLRVTNLTINSLSLVIEQCTGEATVDIARQIYPSVGPLEFKYQKCLNRFSDSGYFFRQEENLKLPVMDTYIFTDSARYLGFYQNAENDELLGRDKINEYFVVVPNPLGSSTSENKIRAVWPQLLFDKVERASGYDDFGAPINLRTYVDCLVRELQR